MDNLYLVEGDILNSKEKFICHQTNCTTLTAKGLAAKIFEKFPHANIYKKGIKRNPGTIMVCGNGHSDDERFVVNIMGQVSPGKSFKEPRLEWFKMALEELNHIEELESVAFPYRIGCGLAGGNWADYLDAIKELASKRKDVRFYIYKVKRS